MRLVQKYRLCGLRSLPPKNALIVAALLGLAAHAAPASAASEEPIAVAVADGRIFTGHVDRKTDESHLWLQMQKPGISLSRAISWDEIVLAQSRQGELTAKQLRDRINVFKLISAQSANEGVQELPTPSENSKPTIEELPPKPTQWVPDHHLSQFIQAARANNTQVCSISIDAFVGHWNRTVESSGMVLHLYPIDGIGRVIPVDGTLDVDLIADVPPGAPQGTSLPRIARWTVRVCPEEFGPNGAVFKLPFQSFHPDFDLALGPYGAVHATLSIPGNGSYEATDAMVRIRPYSAVRDNSQQINGSRYFDIERVNRWEK